LENQGEISPEIKLMNLLSLRIYRKINEFIKLTKTIIYKNAKNGNFREAWGYLGNITGIVKSRSISLLNSNFRNSQIIFNNASTAGFNNTHNIALSQTL
jgi:hypothetical protein